MRTILSSVLCVATAKDELLETLDAYTQKPDCFRDTVSAIRNRCGEVEMTEIERVGGKTTYPLQ